MQKVLYTILLLLFLTGCSEKVNNTVYPANDLEVAQEIKRHKSVDGFIGVVDNHQMLVAINIKRMSRFSKEKIEKKIAQELEKKFPEKEVLVTSDLKIKWEIEKVIDHKLQTEELTKSIEKIKSLSKEET